MIPTSVLPEKTFVRIHKDSYLCFITKRNTDEKNIYTLPDDSPFPFSTSSDGESQHPGRRSTT